MLVEFAGGEGSRVQRARRRRVVLPLLAAICVFASWGGPPARADGDALVIVNGQPIARDRIVELVMEAHGLAAMQQVIVLELAKQEAARRGITVSAAEVEAEFRDALRRIAPVAGAGGTAVTEEERQKALELVLQQKGVSMAEFRLGMERNAYLRKIIARDFRIDEALLREEFNRTYGMKVVVRMIQVGQEDLNAVVAALRTTDFAAVARQYSQDAESAPLGGELPPFALDDAAIPAAMRDVAFALKPGEVSSPIRTGNFFHILKLERRIEPTSVRFEDVRQDVEQRFRDRVIPQEMQRITNELFQQANIRVLDPKLRRQFEDLKKRNAETAAP